MKSLQEHLNEALQPIFEATNIGRIPEFNDFDSIRDYFLSLSGMSLDQLKKKVRDMFGYCVELYGGEWNGRHIYVTYFRGEDAFGNGLPDRGNLGIWYSVTNKKPKFDIFLMRKSGRIGDRGVFPGGSGVDGVQFDLTDSSADIYGNKKAVDELFGKPMPWMRGSEKAICDTINGILKEFGIDSWQMIRKK